MRIFSPYVHHRMIHTLNDVKGIGLDSCHCVSVGVRLRCYSWHILPLGNIEPGITDKKTQGLTSLVPMRSDARPHKGQATNATISSANPRVPTASPTPSSCLRTSVITNETDEFRKTRKEIENKQTPPRYETAWVQLAVNMVYVASNINQRGSPTFPNKGVECPRLEGSRWVIVR